MIPSDIPLDDLRSYELLSRGETIGVFQLESPGMISLLKKVKPNDLQDLSAVLALYRPGPMGNKSHLEFAERKGSSRGPELHPEIDDLISPILEETYGAIVYQEQVMAIIAETTGWDYRQAGLIFDAMRKKDHAKLQSSKPAFWQSGGEHLSEEALEVLWNTLLPFADYSFNKSHSIAYAHISYWCAYLKANYPAKYFASLLSHAKTSNAKKQNEVEIFLKEVSRMGIPILPPDINESDLAFTATERGIRYGICGIKGLGTPTAHALFARRPYVSLDDFFRRADRKVLKSNVLETLVKSGALDSLWSSREELVQQAQDVAQMAIEGRRASKTGQSGFYSDARYRPRKEGSAAQKDSGLRAEWEREALGVQLSWPDLVLKLGRPLSENEWIWVRTIVRSSPGRCTLRLGGLDLGWCTFSEKILEDLRMVSVEASYI